MPTQPIVPYLFFEGRCEEALNFYRESLGAEITFLMRYKESPESCDMIPPGNEEKILHASVRIGDGEIMASDGMCAAGGPREAMRTIRTQDSETPSSRWPRACASPWRP